MTYCPRCGRLVQRKSLLILGIVVVVVLLCGAAYWMLSSSTVPPPSNLKAHLVNDVWKDGKTVWLFIVVQKNLDQPAAQNIINYYASQYASAAILNIDMFCDAKYATRSSVDHSNLSDSEFYSHVLYSYLKSSIDNGFYTPSNPVDPHQGEACRAKQ